MRATRNWRARSSHPDECDWSPAHLFLPNAWGDFRSRETPRPGRALSAPPESLTAKLPLSLPVAAKRQRGNARFPFLTFLGFASLRQRVHQFIRLHRRRRTRQEASMAGAVSSIGTNPHGFCGSRTLKSRWASSIGRVVHTNCSRSRSRGNCAGQPRRDVREPLGRTARAAP
eukprot:COSAG04_NODE_3335_length_2916_cov_382.607739_2_plen_172_part_00